MEGGDGERERRHPRGNRRGSELMKETRILNQAGYRPEYQQQKHRRKAAIVEEKHRPGERGPADEPVPSHHLDPFEHEAQPEAENDADEDRTAHDLRHVADCARETEHEPDDPGREPRRIDRRRSDHRRLSGLGDRHCVDRLHGLNGERRSIIEAANDHGAPERKQDPERIEFQYAEVTDNERDEGTEIANAPAHSIRSNRLWIDAGATSSRLRLWESVIDLVRSEP